MSSLIALEWASSLHVVVVGLGFGEFVDLGFIIVEERLGFKNKYGCSGKERRFDLGLKKEEEEEMEIKFSTTCEQYP